MTLNTGNDELLATRVDKETKRQFRIICAENEESLSEGLKRLVEQFVQKNVQKSTQKRGA